MTKRSKVSVTARPTLPAAGKIRRAVSGALVLLAASCMGEAQTPQSPTPTQASVPTALQQLADAEKLFNSPLPPDSSLSVFLEAADQGNAAAKRDLGLVYQPRDREQALQWFEAAAIAGDARAPSYVGDFYLDPNNGRPEPATARFWYERSYKANDARGTMALAELSCKGTGEKRDIASCGNLLDAANHSQKPTDPQDVKTNLKDDLVALGVIYQQGDQAPRNLLYARDWYAKAAALGSIPGAIAQARLYVEPGGLGQNLPRATAILDAIVALSLHPSHEPWQDLHRPGQTDVAKLYVEIGTKYEHGGPSTIALAIPVYKKAASIGIGAPAILLGQRYAKGNGIPRNIDTAYNVLNGLVGLPIGSDEKFKLAAALDALAQVYANGTGVVANPFRARQLQLAAMKERMPMQMVEAEMGPMAPPPPMAERYPNLQAPDSVPVQQEFAVNVSLNAIAFDAKTQILSGQQDNGKLQITLPAGMTTMPIQVDLIAPGMTFVNGSNTGTITLDSTQPNSTPAVFHLRSGTAPADGVLLATLSYHQIFIAQLERQIAIVSASPDAPTPEPAQPSSLTQTPQPNSPLTQDSSGTATTRSMNSTQLIQGRVPIVGAPAPVQPRTRTIVDSTPPPHPKVAPVVIDPTAKATDLTITETLVGDNLHYAFDSPGLVGTVFADVPNASATKAKVAQAYTQLQAESVLLATGSGASCAADRANGSGTDSDPNCSDSVNARGLVEGIGNDLYDNMAPQSFRDIYQLLTSSHIRLHTITVVTNSPTLPWELMRPRAADKTRAFLGLTAAVVRENMAAPQLAQPTDVQFQGLAVVAPHYGGNLQLNGADAEVKVLKAAFPQMQQVGGDSASVSKMVQNAPQGIIHFTGHGQRIEQHAPSTATATPAPALAPQVAIALEDESMTPSTFVAFREDGKPAHPFYFFNACDLGRSDAQLNYIDGWAPALMQSGASGYLGALYEVGDQSAVSFASHFYSELKKDLASNSNWAMADLVTNARRLTYAESDDPSALAYVLYAKPYMKLVADNGN
jgi:TPR repeat protein